MRLTNAALSPRRADDRKGTILIRDGLIVESRRGCEGAAEARVWDLAGRQLPGVHDAYSRWICRRRSNQNRLAVTWIRTIERERKKFHAKAPREALVESARNSGAKGGEYLNVDKKPPGARDLGSPAR